MIYQLKWLCVPECAYTENMFINAIHISLCDISLTQNILYQIKRDVAVWKRRRCPQCNQRTWWQIAATPYTGLAKFSLQSIFPVGISSENHRVSFTFNDLEPCRNITQFSIHRWFHNFSSLTLSIWISLACARASKLTTTHMYIARARCKSQLTVGSSGLNARWS